MQLSFFTRWKHGFVHYEMKKCKKTLDENTILCVLYNYDSDTEREVTMEYNSSLPIYLQAANSIKQDIVTGKLSPGARLPSVRDLAVEYTINPNTVSRVYKELEMEGVCFTRRGMGTFVTEDPEESAAAEGRDGRSPDREFLEGMEQLGFSRAQAIGLLEKEQSE